MRFFTRIFSLLLFLSPALFSQSQTAELWRKAIDILAANLDWVPGSMTMQFELLDKNGEADMVNTSTYKIYLDENGEVQSELVRMINDGEDVTEKEKAKAEAKEEEKEKENDDAKEQGEDSEEGNVGFSMAESPFHPENQGKIQLKPLDQEKTVDGQVCRGFDYSLPLEENTRIGTAWLNVETGAPVLHEFSTDPLPPRVKEMKNIVRYHYTPAGDFYTTEAMFEGVGGFLFIKKRFRGTMTFEDYWKHEKAQN